MRIVRKKKRVVFLISSSHTQPVHVSENAGPVREYLAYCYDSELTKAQFPPTKRKKQKKGTVNLGLGLDNPWLARPNLGPKLDKAGPAQPIYRPIQDLKSGKLKGSRTT